MLRPKNWFPALLLCATCVLTACGLSPVQPSEVDTGILFTLGPYQPTRFANSIHYAFAFSISNPSGGLGSPVRLGEIVFTLYGPDGAVYGTATLPLNQEMTPGTSMGGAAGAFNDFNLSRPPATRYTGRLSYTRADGRPVVLDRESTFLPPS